MIDVSDGLGIDLDHLATASGVGVVLDTVPIADGASPDEALTGGEDYELVFAAGDPDALAGAFAAAGLRPPIRIGRCVPDRTLRLLGADPLPARGWEHRLERG
jgi:thiamine-monophosphate kinase